MKILICFLFASSVYSQDNFDKKNQEKIYQAQMNKIRGAANLLLEREKALIDLQTSLNQKQDFENELHIQRDIPDQTGRKHYLEVNKYLKGKGEYNEVNVTHRNSEGQLRTQTITKSIYQQRSDLFRADKKLKKYVDKYFKKIKLDKLDSEQRKEVEGFKNYLEKVSTGKITAKKSSYNANSLMKEKRVVVSKEVKDLVRDTRIKNSYNTALVLEANQKNEREFRVKEHKNRLNKLQKLKDAKLNEKRQALINTMKESIEGIDAILDSSDRSTYEYDGKKRKDYKNEKNRYEKMILAIKGDQLKEDQINKMLDKEIKAREQMLGYYELVNNKPGEYLLEKGRNKITTSKLPNVERQVKSQELSAKEARDLVSSLEKLSDDPTVQNNVQDPSGKTTQQSTNPSSYRAPSGISLLGENKDSGDKTANQVGVKKKIRICLDGHLKYLGDPIDKFIKDSSGKKIICGQKTATNEVSSQAASQDDPRNQVSDKIDDTASSDLDKNAVCYNPEWVQDLPRRTIFGFQCGSSKDSKVCVGHVKCQNREGNFSFVRMSTCSVDNCGEEDAEACTKEEGYGSREPIDFKSGDGYENNILRYNVGRQ